MERTAFRGVPTGCDGRGESTGISDPSMVAVCGTAGLGLCFGSNSGAPETWAASQLVVPTPLDALGVLGRLEQEECPVRLILVARMPRASHIAPLRLATGVWQAMPGIAPWCGNAGGSMSALIC
mmetsp:Transcript_85575/g.169828  ORF Transcript_85575/g.169828 Transcript_85575/m.169828 type:complete len:124 (+) Transcript_85575:213-584(+)